MSELLALFQVILIDISLSGDNAIIIGMAAAGLPAHQRKPAILLGITAAIVLRVLFSAVTVHLLQFPVIMLIGGVMLLWVCWKMWGEIRGGEASNGGIICRKTLPAAVLQIVIADVSMSLDNVLAVAGASSKHVLIMAFGLVFSIAIMAVAANWIAGVLNRHKWLAHAGVAVILYVALSMVWQARGVVSIFMAHAGGVLGV